MPRVIQRKAAAPAGGMAGQDFDVLKWPAAKRAPRRTRLRIGIHTSTSGGVALAAERAHRLGCNALQIFSSSPRQWRGVMIGREQSEEMQRLRARYDLNPLVVHTNYLVNVCSATAVFREKSVEAFRGEVERALALKAEYLVLHPGSFRGMTREEGLRTAAESIARAVEGLDLEGGGLRILIENTAGAEFSLGGSFEQVGELVARLENVAPVGACLDTCHTHVAGYDITSDEGLAATLALAERTIGLERVRVWHVNDAKKSRGSKLDRHEHIGRGTIGRKAFARLLNEERVEHAAFIAETPIDEPGDDLRNVETLKKMVRKKV